MFSDEEDNESGGLFGSNAAPKPQKTKTETRPKSKTTISLFDEDEQDDDFFVPSKPNSDATKKTTSNEVVEEVI